MCQICASFNPFLAHCEYEGLTGAPGGTGTPVAQIETVLEAGDAAGSTATTATMNVGEAFLGTLGSTNDSDWIAVELVSGQQYTIAIAGTGALSTSNDDPYLRIRNDAGTTIMQDDDDGPGTYSSHTFVAAYTGTYYIDAQSWNNSDAGTYGVTVTEGSKASFSPEMISGALMRPDQSWATTPGGGATVTWGIRETLGTEPSGGNAAVAMSAAQVIAAQSAMSYLDALSGLTLNQVNEKGTTDSATILFGAYDADDGSGAYAYYPGSVGGDTSFGSNAGDIWMNNNAGSTSSLPFGSYSYFVFLHEIGHAIGLAHPGDYNAAPGVSITYANNAQFIQDSHQYTVMSYFDETNTGVRSGLGYPDTFMLYDLLAIHELYGADTSYHAGDTTYGFNTTDLAGTAYDFVANNTPFLSIYDGSGTDTIDLSGYYVGQVLDLNEGAFSSLGGYTNNVSIAYGAVIENAIGTFGNDTIEGNAADNRIDGNGGLDVFVMNINRAAATITAITGGYQVVSSLGTDTLIGVEYIEFNDQTLDLANITGGGGGGTPTSGADTLTGAVTAESTSLLAGNDLFDALGGNDTVFGNQGNDTINGGAGNDSVRGGYGDDEINGGADNDTLFGNLGNDTLNGDAGNDTLLGGYGADLMNGGADNDSLFGFNGADTLNGGDGNDIVRGGRAADLLNGGSGNDSVFGGYGEDTLNGNSGNDTIYGRRDNDTLNGGDDDDVLYGNQGFDVLFGDAGNDTLEGGYGYDTLNGGAGNDELWGNFGFDQFVFAAGGGQDTIQDFQDDIDTISLDSSLWSAFGNLTVQEVVTQFGSVSGGVATFDFGSGNTLEIRGVNGVAITDINDLVNDIFTF